MNIPIDKFISIVPKDSIFEVIKVTEENLKYIYTYLKENGCESFPDENQAAGQIWLYDREVQDCVAYTDNDFNDIRWVIYEPRA